MNFLRTFRLATLLAALFSLAVLLSAQRSPAEEPGAFAAASAAAQSRTVKIFGGSIGRTPGYASGILVSSTGEIITGQGSLLATDNLRVSLPDGSVHPARVVRRSQGLQAALLKIDAETPAFFDLSQKPAAETGDWVLAVSNAFKVADGSEPLSVNVGVVSLRTKLDARRGMQEFPYEGEVFLIDAITSNPGAAGGAVVDLEGHLVGMIGKVIEGKTTNTRLNYAVPHDLLADFLAGKEPPPPAVVASGSKGELGIRVFPLGGRKSPAYIDRVVPGSPAAIAGLKADDLVVSLAGEAVHEAGDFQRLAEGLAAGQEVVVEVKRKKELLTFRIVPTAKGVTP